MSSIQSIHSNVKVYARWCLLHGRVGFGRSQGTDHKFKKGSQIQEKRSEGNKI